MKNYRVYLKHYTVLWGVFIAITVFLAFSFRNNKSQQFENDSLSKFSDGWALQDGTQVRLTHISDTRKKTDPLSVPTIILNTLPSDLRYGDCICFLSKNMNFTMQIDGKPMYRYWPQMDRMSGKSYGTSYHIVKIPVSFSGKEVRIFIYPKYKDNSCYISSMYIGQTGLYYRTFMKQKIVPFMICLLIMNIGLVMIIISTQQWNINSGAAYSLISLGTLSVMIGIWSALQTNMPQMFLGFTPFFHMLEYTLILFMPYPAIQYANYIISRPSKKYSLLMLSIIISVQIGCIVSTLTGYRDFHECLPLIHAVVLIGFAVIIYMTADDYLYRRKSIAKDNKLNVNIPVIAGFVLFLFSTLADLAEYAVSGARSSDPGRYMRIGALINTSVLMGYTINLMMRNMKTAGETEAVKKLAYTDALTEMPNRTAYLQAETEIQNDLLSGKIKKVMVIQSDINDLKKVNDNYGHQCGDRFIIRASDVLNRSFGKYGTCYRVGGDEFTSFIVLAEDKDAERVYLECIGYMNGLLEKENAGPGTLVPLTIACGYSVYDGRNVITLENAEINADQNMYTDKKRIKISR